MIEAIAHLGSVVRWIWNTKILKRDKTIEIDGKQYNYTLTPEERLPEYIHGDNSSPVLDTFLGAFVLFLILSLVILIILGLDNINR